MSSPRYKKISSLPEFIDAIRIRADVFIKEQGFAPGWEPDEDDKISQHFIATINEQVVATARVREVKPGEVKIERMAVMKNHRGRGIGKGLINHILAHIKTKNPRRIWMHCQLHTKGFYEKSGFQAVSESFDLYGSPHVEMEYKQ